MVSDFGVGGQMLVRHDRRFSRGVARFAPCQGWFRLRAPEVTQHDVNAQPPCVVDIVMAWQSIVDRLTQRRRQTALLVAPHLAN